MQILSNSVCLVAVAIVLLGLGSWLMMDLARWACPRCRRELTPRKKFFISLPYPVMITVAVCAWQFLLVAWIVIGGVCIAPFIDTYLYQRRPQPTS